MRAAFRHFVAATYSVSAPFASDVHNALISPGNASTFRHTWKPPSEKIAGKFTDEPAHHGKEKGEGTLTRDESRDGRQVIPRAEGRARSFHSSNYYMIIRISRPRVTFMRFCDPRSPSLRRKCTLPLPGETRSGDAA